jgi:transposase
LKRGKKVVPALEAAMVAAYASGWRVAVIAERFSVSGMTVRSVLNRNGVVLDQRKARTHHSPSEEAIAEMVRLYVDEELNTHQIAKKLSVGSATVVRYLNQRGVPMRAHVKRHKLSVEQRSDLVLRYHAGENFKDLERAYGVSNQVVEDCLKESGTKARAPGKRLPASVDASGRTWFFGSRWDQLYAGWLDGEGYEWAYEARCFKLAGDDHKQYTPDFVVMVDGVEEYHEVKGWLDAVSIERIKAFAAQYPREAARLKLIGPAEMAALGLESAWYEQHRMSAAVDELRVEIVHSTFDVARA